MKRRIYFSVFGYVISFIQHVYAFAFRSTLVYGYWNRHDKRFYRRTRIASSVVWSSRRNINIKDNVWIGHYSVVDGTGGLTISEGVQVSAHCCVYTHSSQDAIRFLGYDFMMMDAVNRENYHMQPVVIGEYSFIGASSVILPGTSIGKGCIVGAGVFIIMGKTIKIGGKFILISFLLVGFFIRKLKSSLFEIKLTIP